ncbi:stage II sporulation protein P [Evansella halocellulosilytica]|uniref:stage II sporulation protein P n=1 Tax=Evansella halocellulosilytica TaxID=2011013 RepID=UPI000BB9A6C9|nr:stage II sporulation protein P [Evansella halocellulosilytica]
MKRKSIIIQAKDSIIITFISIVTLFIIVSVLTETNVSSANVKQWVANITEEHLLYVMSFENRYFEQALPETFEKPSPARLTFQLATSLDPGDVRSLLGREIPGLATFNTRIVVAGEGTDFTTLPYESSPPLEVLMEEREASYEESADESEEGSTESESSDQERDYTHIGDDKPSVLVYHTHSWESYLPHLNVGNDDPNLATHNEVNITMVGEEFGKELEKRGFNVIVDTTNMTNKLHEREWETHQSYELSREIVDSTLEEDPDIDFFFDLHRDSVRRDVTTVETDGQTLARTFFVIGESHAEYEKNEQVANEFHDHIEDLSPGLSRGLFSRDRTQGNGVYNQDLSEYSFLLEIGGVDNTLDESYKSVEVVAEAFANYYLELKEEGRIE